MQCATGCNVNSTRSLSFLYETLASDFLIIVIVLRIEAAQLNNILQATVTSIQLRLGSNAHYTPVNKQL